jgi:outer membrane protein assembly factor BamB
LSRDWRTSPPRKIWRQPIGTGWSSFAVVGDFSVTQEQRGEDETVVCYDIMTGAEVWEHRDPGLFHEVMGGDGPRGTPTIDYGRVYALGATGTLNCLEGGTGSRVWTRNILEDAGCPNRPFGMAGSPLIMHDLVVVCPGGKHRSLIAYDRRSGDVRWSAGGSRAAYSSPTIATLAGIEQILIFNADGLFSHDPDDGRVLWSQPWVTPPELNNVCQPVPLPATSLSDTDHVFLASGYEKGCGLLEVRRAGEEYRINLQWANRNLKPKFSSVVVRDGFVYGLDDRILTCVDLRTGQRRWKAGRYGYGQLVLVDDLLLIQAESGEIALVEAAPEEYRELARLTALDHRTWTHPALAGSYLLVRNDREAACYELPRGRHR